MKKTIITIALFCLALAAPLLAQPAAPRARPSSAVDKKSLVELMTRITDNFIRNTPLTRGEYHYGDWEDVKKSTLPKTCYWSYPTGVSLLALQRVYDITGDEKILKFVVENNEISAEQYSHLRWQKAKFGQIYKSGGFEKLWRLSMLDDCGAMGAEILDTKLRHGVALTPQENELIEIIGNYVTKIQSRLPDGAFWRPESPDGPTMWADDMFMSVPFLIRWGEDKKDPAVLDDAAQQIINYAARLQDRDGVWFHAWFVEEKKANGFKWGRANGWVSVAMAELLSALPADHPKRPTVLDIYRRQMEGLRKLQSPSGLWHQVLDHPELAWGTETSCSGQFTYAMARGVNRGWLDDSFRENVNKALAGLAGQITPEGGINNVCQSTSIGRDLAYYNARAKKDNDQHGFGLVLLALAEAWAMEPTDSASARRVSSFYVALDGNDANPGTMERPWKSITAAAAKLKPGDTLFIRGGTCYEVATVSASGTASAPIVIQSYPGERAVIDSGGPEFKSVGNRDWELVDAALGEYRFLTERVPLSMMFFPSWRPPRTLPLRLQPGRP